MHKKQSPQQQIQDGQNPAIENIQSLEELQIIMSNSKSVDQLEKEYKDKLLALKQEKKNAIAQSKLHSARLKAQEQIILRKQDAHIKILIGGFVIAQKNIQTLNQLLNSGINDSDKVLISKLVTDLQSTQSQDTIADRIRIEGVHAQS
jgi:hypothetical protein